MHSFRTIDGARWLRFPAHDASGGVPSQEPERTERRNRRSSGGLGSECAGNYSGRLQLQARQGWAVVRVEEHGVSASIHE
jgi:hypothetical protein